MSTIKNLQFLRALGAMMIFIHHFGFNNHIVNSFGDCGVCWFMMLSGFVGYRAWRQGAKRGSASLWRETLTFLKKRIFKLAPMYYVGLFLSLLLAKFTFSKLSLIATGLMVQSWIPDRDVFFGPNSPSWFVSSILLSYLLFPTLRRIPESRLVKILCLVVAVYFCVIWTIPEADQLYWVYIFPPMQFPVFLIGMCVWLCIEKYVGRMYEYIYI